MRRAFRLLAVISAIALVVDCGGESERASFERQPQPKPGPVPEPPPSAEALELARAQCDYLERCDPDGMFAFQNASRAAFEKYFACQAADPPPWQRPHALPVTLEECVGSLRSRECPDYERQPSERFSEYAAFPWGPGCGIPDAEARRAPRPDAWRTGETCLVGDLLERQTEAAVCERGTECVVAKVPDFANFYCGVCEPRTLLGEPCGGEVGCVEGAECVLGTCRKLRDLGEPCETLEECLTHACDDGVCSRSVYAPTPYAEMLDHACDEDWLCGRQVGLSCVAGICRPRTNEGERCGTSDTAECSLGLRCFDGRCVAFGCRIDVGEPCDFSCEAGGCDARDGVCKPAVAVGDPCTLRCENGLVCHSKYHECRLLRANGTACDFDDDCASNFCERDLSDVCSGGLCTIPFCGGCGTCADPPTVERCDPPNE